MMTQPTPPTEQRTLIGPILRDVVIICILTAIGGFIAGVAVPNPQRDALRFLIAVALSNLLLGTVGFTIAGGLAPPGRWRHLSRVAAGVWLAGLINVAFFGSTIPEWIVSVFFIVIMMGLGGALSYLFKR